MKLVKRCCNGVWLSREGLIKVVAQRDGQKMRVGGGRDNLPMVSQPSSLGDCSL